MFKYGKFLQSGLIENDDKPLSVGVWLMKSFRKAHSSFNYKNCFIVDVDGRKLPNKLDFYAFRRGKILRAGEESDRREEEEEEEAKKREGTRRRRGMMKKKAKKAPRTITAAILLAHLPRAKY